MGLVMLQMAPRTRRQTRADQKGKGIMNEEEAQRADRAEESRSPDRESLASIVQPHEEPVRPTSVGRDEAGLSQPHVERVTPTQPEGEKGEQPRPNPITGVDMEVLVQVMTDVARNVMADMLRETNAQNQERRNREHLVATSAPVPTEVVNPTYDLRTPFG